MEVPTDRPDRSHRDERDDLAYALAATRRLKGCRCLPDHTQRAAEAFAELLAHYAPEGSLRVAGSVIGGES